MSTLGHPSMLHWPWTDAHRTPSSVSADQVTREAARASARQAAQARAHRVALVGLVTAVAAFWALTAVLLAIVGSVHPGWPWAFVALITALAALWLVLLARIEHR